MLDWYTLNVHNQKLYYMLLMDAQKERSIVIMPSIHVTRALLTQASYILL